jgi:hypothetical protein
MQTEVPWTIRLKSPPPELLVRGSAQRTESSSWHPGLLTNVPIVPWLTFDSAIQEIMGQACDKALAKGTDFSYSKVPEYLFGERAECITAGDEHTVQGRFFENVINPVVCLLDQFNEAFDAGDFKVADKKKIRTNYPRAPDFLVAKEAGRIPVLIGGQDSVASFFEGPLCPCFRARRG